MLCGHESSIKTRLNTEYEFIVQIKKRQKVVFNVTHKAEFDF